MRQNYDMIERRFYDCLFFERNLIEMEIVNISKSYGKKKVLHDISMTVREGKCTGVIGANGCGKSTLFRIMAGIEKADGGKILLNGKEKVNSAKELTRLAGYIPQDNALLEELTVRDNLLLWASFGDVRTNNERIKELSLQFNILGMEKEKVKNLSGGMKKRVSIACALVNQPKLLIMDEPSAALDLVFKEELKQYMSHFTKQGGSILISSHDEGEILSCDELYAIRNGVAEHVPAHLSVAEIISQYIR